MTSVGPAAGARRRDPAIPRTRVRTRGRTLGVLVIALVAAAAAIGAGAAPAAASGSGAPASLTVLVAPGTSVELPARMLAPRTPAAARRIEVLTAPRTGTASVTNADADGGAVLRYTAPADRPTGSRAGSPAGSQAGSQTGSPAGSRSAGAAQPTDEPISFVVRVCGDGAGTDATTCSEVELRILLRPTAMVAAEPGQRQTLTLDELVGPGGALPSDGTRGDEAAALDATSFTAWTVPTSDSAPGGGRATSTAHADGDGLAVTAGPHTGTARLAWRACDGHGACLLGTLEVRVVPPLTPVHLSLRSRIAADGSVLLPASVDAATGAATGQDGNVIDLPTLRIADGPRFRPAEPGSGTPDADLHASVVGGNILVSGLAPGVRGVLEVGYVVCSAVDGTDCVPGSIRARVEPIEGGVDSTAGPGDGARPTPAPAAAETGAKADASASAPRAGAPGRNGGTAEGDTEAGSATRASASEDSDAQAAGGTDVTWWVLGGALLFMLGGGATVVVGRKG